MTTILSNGGGTQSTALLALIVQGRLPRPDYGFPVFAAVGTVLRTAEHHMSILIDASLAGTFHPEDGTGSFDPDADMKLLNALREQAEALSDRGPYSPHVEEIDLDEFVRREHGNWAGVTDAVAWVRERRADAEPDAEPDAEVPLFGGPL